MSGVEEQGEYGSQGPVGGWRLQAKESVDMELKDGARLIAISDRYQNYMGLIAEGSFAENGKLVDQHGTYHQCFEACIHMASLAW